MIREMMSGTARTTEQTPIHLSIFPTGSEAHSCKYDVKAYQPLLAPLLGTSHTDQTE